MIHVNFDINETAALNADNITVTNGNLVNFVGSGDTYSAEIEPNGDGEVKTSATGFVDESGNVGVLSDTAVIESDRTAPQLVIDGPAAVYSGNDAEMTYTSTEAIVDFDNSDIELDNGESVNFAGNGADWSSTITGMVPGQTHVNVNGEYFDIAGNEGLAVEEFTVDILTGTSEVEAVKGTNVYPNPANSLINIESDNSMKNISIYNQLGAKVAEKNFAGNLYSPKAMMDISNLPKGIYVVRIIGDDGSFSRKKIVKN